MATKEAYTPELYEANDIGQYRKDYSVQTAGLTDEQLYDIVMSTEDDLDPQGWIELFVLHSAPQKQTARSGNVGAIKFALKGGAAFNALLSGIADQKAAERRGSLHAMLFLETHYDLSEIPVVGSKKEDSGNRVYDKYTAEVDTPNGKRKVPGSFYTDAVKAVDEYERVQKRIRWLDGGAEEGEVVDADIRPHIKTARGNEMKAEMRDRISDMRTGLTKGSMLLHHAAAIDAINPERIRVKMPFRNQPKLVNGERVKIDGTNEFETETIVYGSKIRLQDPANEFEDKIYSVSSFLQLKWDNELFLKSDKTIVTLDETTKRPPKKAATPGTAADVKVPTTLEQLLTQFNVLASGMDQEQDQGERLYAALLTKASGKDADAVEARSSIAKVCLTCDALWTIIRPMYLIDVERKAAANIASQIPKTGT